MARLRHLGSIRCKKRAWMRDRPWYETFVSSHMDDTPRFSLVYAICVFNKLSIPTTYAGGEDPSYDNTKGPIKLNAC